MCAARYTVVYVCVCVCVYLFFWYATKHYNNESTAGADASVEVPKLHNIKLVFIHTLIISIIILYYNDEHL